MEKVDEVYHFFGGGGRCFLVNAYIYSKDQLLGQVTNRSERWSLYLCTLEKNQKDNNVWTMIGIWRVRSNLLMLKACQLMIHLFLHHRKQWCQYTFKGFLLSNLSVLILLHLYVHCRWSRGTIVAVNDAGEFDVFFVDYGDQEWKKRDEIRRPWNDILKVRLIGYTLISQPTRLG